MVGFVVHRLLTDEDLRVRFALDRIEALTAISFEGGELTPDEIDLFYSTDPRLWFWGKAVVGDLRH